MEELINDVLVLNKLKNLKQFQENYKLIYNKIKDQESLLLSLEEKINNVPVIDPISDTDMYENNIDLIIKLRKQYDLEFDLANKINIYQKICQLIDQCDDFIKKQKLEVIEIGS